MIVSIDPGTKGALAVLRDDGHLVDVADMPTRVAQASPSSKPRTVVDAMNLYGWARPGWLELEYGVSETVRLVLVERAWPRPGEESRAAFRQGQNHGVILGAFGCYRIDEVAPATWKAGAGIRSADDVPKDERKRDQERQCMARAAELWPHLADRFQHVTRAGRAEAAIMGRWYLSELSSDKDRTATEPGSVT